MKDKPFEKLYVEEQQKDLIISKNLINYKKKTYYSLNNMKEKRTKKKKKKRKRNYTIKTKKLLLLNIEPSLTKIKTRSNRLSFQSCLVAAKYETENSDK